MFDIVKVTLSNGGVVTDPFETGHCWQDGLTAGDKFGFTVEFRDVVTVGRMALQLNGKGTASGTVVVNNDVDNPAAFDQSGTDYYYRHFPIIPVTGKALRFYISDLPKLESATFGVCHAQFWLS